MTDKVYLGRFAKDAGTFADGERVYLTKHAWTCGWYWSFGHIGNVNTHFHADSLLYIKDGKGSCKYLARDIFAETNITDDEWWVIRDLLVQAYALRKAAEVYQYGGHQTSKKGITDLIRNPDIVARLNTDLRTVLDTLWAYVCEAVKTKQKAEVV